MKEKILNEAERLFWKYGVRTITMDDIARRLAISKKTIYQYFTDKEDIVYQVVNYHIEHEMIECTRLIDQSMNPLEEMLMISDLMRRNADMVNPSLLMDVQRYYPKAWDAFLQHKEGRIITDIKANLQRGVDQGLYRTDIDLETMARLRVELIQLGFDDRAFPNNKDVMTTQDQLLHLFLRGILSEQGFTVYNTLKNKEYNLTAYENK
ncbi:TetR/AcrR family transcriptional regulator [Fibrella sp. HMF5335]|uniref:TetR/AcrR family transcriptional regulator n=1 Tax=Fibrella rubiginis TaxID=2817060 RepID=A0A939GEN2_9BACT|nr:TetR/AcrR family transcriptional regulator [Fibrella rubiginis]MBO0937737.1 TetR/AcrR family transcriptional regulator [Fibrella rubiginis]